MTLATPVLPPVASLQAKGGRLVVGGAGWARAVDRAGAKLRPAGGQRRDQNQAQGDSHRPMVWSRPSGPRRGGGTGRRVGLKNRCPQGRAGSTPALGTRLPSTVWADRYVWRQKRGIIASIGIFGSRNAESLTESARSLG